MFSLLFALVLVSQVGQVDKKPTVPEEDLQSVIFGTGLSMYVHKSESGELEVWLELQTDGKFTNGWDSEVVERANKWANYASPNIHIKIEMKGGKWRIEEIYSAADPWNRGGTPMHEVADDYQGRRINTKTLNRLLADMRTAYHQYFGDEKK